MRSAAAAVLSPGSTREADAPQAPIDKQAALAAVRAAVDEMTRAASAASAATAAAAASTTSASASASTSEADSASPASAAAEGLHTLVVCLSSQLKHPSEARYHRINTQNANLKRLLSLPGAQATLRALGFAQDEPAAGASSTTHFWVWRRGRLPTPTELELIAEQRDLLLQLQAGGS